MASTAHAFLREVLKRYGDGDPSPVKDSVLTAMGLLAVAESLESVAAAIDELAGEQNAAGDKVAKALGEALESIEIAIRNYS